MIFYPDDPVEDATCSVCGLAVDVGPGGCSCDRNIDEPANELTPIDALYATNEQLGKDLTRALNANTKLSSELLALHADTERLDREVKAWEERALVQLAENEQLKAQHANDLHTIDVGSKANAALHIENERLETELANCRKVRDAAIGRLKAGGLEAENERLRALLKDMRESSGAILNEHWQERLDELTGPKGPWI